MTFGWRFDGHPLGASVLPAPMTSSFDGRDVRDVGAYTAGPNRARDDIAARDAKYSASRTVPATPITT